MISKEKFSTDFASIMKDAVDSVFLVVYSRGYKTGFKEGQQYANESFTEEMMYKNMKAIEDLKLIGKALKPFIKASIEEVTDDK